jgi:uncharacterized protein YccT (UPF0319 family)
MTGLSKIPGANAMAVFHDQWAVGWNMPPGVLQGTIYPAVILTYNGSSAPLLEQVREQALKSKSGQSFTTKDPLVVVRDDTKNVPIKQDRLEVTYACAAGDNHRSIAVEVDTEKKDFACRVVYRANNLRTIPWRAVNETDYCYRQAMKLANNQIDYGYSCVVATATERKK